MDNSLAPGTCHLCTRHTRSQVDASAFVRERVWAIERCRLNAPAFSVYIENTLTQSAISMCRNFVFIWHSDICCAAKSFSGRACWRTLARFLCDGEKIRIVCDVEHFGTIPAFCSSRCFRITHDDSWLTALNGNLRHLPCIPLYARRRRYSVSPRWNALCIPSTLAGYSLFAVFAAVPFSIERFQFAVIIVGFASNEPAFAETKWLKINTKLKLLFLSCAPLNRPLFSSIICFMLLPLAAQLFNMFK